MYIKVIFFSTKDTFSLLFLVKHNRMKTDSIKYYLLKKLFSTETVTKNM